MDEYKKIFSGTTCLRCKLGKLEFDGLKVEDTDVGPRLYRLFRCNNPECKCRYRMPTLVFLHKGK